MTLVLSCINRRYVMQASDRRLTDLRTGALIDDEQNKAVLYGRGVAFAYTGLAEIAGQRTDVWLTNKLSEVGSIGEAVARVASTATADFGARSVPHAFVAVGWATFPPRSGIEPFYCSISNAQGSDGRWLNAARRDFQILLVRLDARARSATFCAGQRLRRSEAKALDRTMRRAVSRNLQPSTAGEELTQALRTVASRNTAVGRSLLLNCVPREAYGKESWNVKAAAPTSKDQTFLYIPNGSVTGVANTPNVALPGGIRIIDTTLLGQAAEATFLRVEASDSDE